MDEYIKKTANIEDVKKVLKNLENNLNDLENNLSQLKEYFYKNAKVEMFQKAYDKFFFMKFSLKDLIKEIRKIKRFKRKCVIDQ
jgi:archaellum component FlaC